MHKHQFLGRKKPFFEMFEGRGYQGLGVRPQPPHIAFFDHPGGGAHGKSYRIINRY